MGLLRNQWDFSQPSSLYHLTSRTRHLEFRKSRECCPVSVVVRGNRRRSVLRQTASIGAVLLLVSVFWLMPVSLASVLCLDTRRYLVSVTGTARIACWCEAMLRLLMRSDADASDLKVCFSRRNKRKRKEKEGWGSRLSCLASKQKLSRIIMREESVRAASTTKGAL